jgi:hypothetical protein
VGAGSAGGGGGGGPLTSNPKSPPPEASAPIVSASALPAPASEKASAAATALVIFKDVRTFDSDNKMSPLSVVGFGATPRETITRSIVGRMSPRWPGSHQGTAGPHTGGVKPRSKGLCRITPHIRRITAPEAVRQACSTASTPPSRCSDRSGSPDGRCPQRHPKPSVTTCGKSSGGEKQTTDDAPRGDSNAGYQALGDVLLK